MARNSGASVGRVEIVLNGERENTRPREVASFDGQRRAAQSGGMEGRAVPSWWNSTWPVLTGVLGGLLLLWLVLLVVLWRAAPDQPTVCDALRLLPNAVRLIRRMAGDRSLPRDVRVRLVLLLAYLASLFDLVPDFIPVLG